MHLFNTSLVKNTIQNGLPEPDLHVYEAGNNEQIYKLRKLEFSL